MLSYTYKSIVSPFVAITFGAVSLSGILLLFHHKIPAVHEIHQWGGLIFLTVGIVHLILNWRTFATYFKDSRVVWCSLAGALAMALMIAIFPNAKDGDHTYEKGQGGTYYHQERHR